jgi:hypothetical protein
MAEHPEYEQLMEDVSEPGHERLSQLLEELTHEMRTWYNSGLNNECVSEVRTVLGGLQGDDESTSEETKQTERS